MAYLDQKIVIYVQGTSKERRYFNRATQCYSLRWNGLKFYDNRGAAVNPYFNSWSKHINSFSMWERLLENDKGLAYHKTKMFNVRNTTNGYNS